MVPCTALTKPAAYSQNRLAVILRRERLRASKDRRRTRQTVKMSKTSPCKVTLSADMDVCRLAKHLIRRANHRHYLIIRQFCKVDSLPRAERPPLRDSVSV